MRHGGYWTTLGIAILAALAATGCAAEPPASAPGAVSAATPEAAAAGREILEAGGNAVDAAVAVAFTLAVTEPAGSGLGGQTTFLIHSPKRAPLVLNGSSFSPRGTPENPSPKDLAGRHYSSVPSTVRTLGYAWARHGSGRITWSQVMAPAVRAAEEGFAWGPFRFRALLNYGDELSMDPATARLFLQPGGTLPEAGSIHRQPELAATLKRLAENGAGDFYEGEIAGEIARDMAENGGWITREDLRTVPDPVELPALKSTYRGWDVYTTPPPTGGWVVLQVLNILERAPARALSRESPERTVWLAESLRIGHRSRKDRPVADLVHYQDDVAEKIDKMVASDLARSFEPPEGSGETTHFSVVDADGMAVAVTQSINSYFGVKLAHPRLGFLYNDYLKEFELMKPGHPYSLGSHKMPYSSMAPSVLSKNGQVGLVLGSPGSARIISTVAQTISHWVDVNSGVEAAVAVPRIHVVPENDLYFEVMELDDNTKADLAQRGFQIRRPRTGLAIGNLDAYFGGVHAVARENGVWKGAADPRRDGVVAYPSAVPKRSAVK